MATNSSLIFRGSMDRFNGITVDSSKEPCGAHEFSEKLQNSLISWMSRKVRGVWFKVALQHADWVPILAQEQFWFHHAHKDTVTMCRWLPDESTERCNIPSYAHTMLSVGGLVTDSQARLLVVKERFWRIPNWKLPGGYVENREDVAAAAVREVFEETGLHVKFNSLVGFLHSHTSQFGCSDIYMIAHLSPEDESQPIKKCEREIADCCWMKIEDYLQHGEVHQMNQMLVRKFLENKQSRVTMQARQIPHPIFSDKQVTIFNLDAGPAPASL